VAFAGDNARREDFSGIGAACGGRACRAVALG